MAVTMAAKKADVKVDLLVYSKAASTVCCSADKLAKREAVLSADLTVSRMAALRDASSAALLALKMAA